MNTISRYWNDKVGGYRWSRQEDFNENFGTDVKSDLTASSSQKSQNWHCYDGNLTKRWLPMWKKTLSGFQQFIQEPQPVNGLRVMIFERWWGCWKLHFCTDCSVEREINSGAVRLGFFPWDDTKTWITLLSFRQLLIQPHSTNGLEDTEFWRYFAAGFCFWTGLRLNRT
jgi:hypothetical protein